MGDCVGSSDFVRKRTTQRKGVSSLNPMVIISRALTLPLLLASSNHKHRQHAPWMLDDAVVSSPERWWVDPPSTFEAMQDQATRSVASALPSGRVLVECAVPELDPSNENFKPQELVSFVHDLAAPLLARARLPKSKDHIKLLFNSMGEATIAGASIMTTSLPVSVLGHPSAIGPRDGAFIVVAPTCSSGGLDTEAALRDLTEAAGARPVILVNPRMGNSPLLEVFGEPAYLMRMLSFAYMRDQSATQVSRVSACLLRCHPHEWSVLVDEAPINGPASAQPAGAARRARRWKYAGRFAKQPPAKDLETLLAATVTKLRDARGLEEARRRRDVGAAAEEDP